MALTKVSPEILDLNNTLAVLSILQGYVGFLPVGQATQAVIGIGIAVCIVVLRSVTTMPLSAK